jgi:hypothetical protein
MPVEEIKKQIPELRFRYLHEDEDPRDYRVSFKKIRAFGFQIARLVPDGIREIRAAASATASSAPRTEVEQIRSPIV